MSGRGIDDELREAIKKLRTKPTALSDLIPLMQRAADRIDATDDLIRNWRARLDGVPMGSGAYDVAVEMDAAIERGRR